MSDIDLPVSEILRKRWQTFAYFDSVFSPEWEYRYFSFDADWWPGETLASMRDGSGNTIQCLFTTYWAVMSASTNDKAHSFSLKPDDLPPSLSSFALEKAFDVENMSFCIYYETSSRDWVLVWWNLDNSLFHMLRMDTQQYTKWASDYYELKIDGDLIEKTLRNI